jgi:hypothetical protein
MVILHEILHEFRISGRKGILFKIDFEKAYDKVKWEFVQEVLCRKGFPLKWIQQTISTVQGGRVCINVNGDRTPYFRTYQGLRQGGLLSLVLFNLVADTLSTLMSRAAERGYIRGVVSHLIPGRISHAQYVDDTILMVEGNDNSIIHMKFRLYYFEWLSGLKFNYYKSEAFTFGMGEEESRRVANMLNCQLGELPMKYLGIPLNDTSLGMGAFSDLVDKVVKRIPPWKGKNSSLGGRLILSNSCLASLPVCTMDFYLLHKGTHKRMYTIRSRFFGGVQEMILSITWLNG